MLRLPFSAPAELTAAEHRRSAAVVVTRFPIDSSGTSPTSSRTGRRGRPATSSSRRGSSDYAALKGTLARRRRPPARTRSGCRRSWDSSPIASGTTRRCSTTRTSATTRSTRSGSRCRSSSRDWARRNRGSTPSCSRSRWPRSAAGWTARAELARLPLRDREPVPPAGARARRGAARS